MFTDELDQRTVEIRGCLNWYSSQMHHVHLQLRKRVCRYKYLGFLILKTGFLRRTVWRGHGICPLCYKTRILMSCSKNLAGNERVRETFGLLSVEMHAQEIGLVTPSQSRSISSIH